MRRWQASIERPRRQACRPGFITTEVLIAIGLTAVLALLITAAVLQYSAARRENDTRHMLRLAAATELARIRAGLTNPASFDSDSPTAQSDETQIAVTTTPGEGLWQGLTRVRVVASQMVLGARRIEVELVAYVATGGNSP